MRLRNNNVWSPNIIRNWEIELSTGENQTDLGLAKEKQRVCWVEEVCGGRKRGISGGERREETLESDRDSDPALRQAIFFTLFHWLKWKRRVSEPFAKLLGVKGFSYFLWRRTTVNVGTCWDPFDFGTVRFWYRPIVGFRCCWSSNLDWAPAQKLRWKAFMGL